jgi:hypothetical protein
VREGQAEGPAWLTVFTENELIFTQAMRLLCNVGLVEANKCIKGEMITEQNGYSMYGCIHA